MIYTLYGENAVLRQRHQAKLIDQFQQQFESAIVERIDAEDVDELQCRQALHGVSLFSPHKLVCIYKLSAQNGLAVDIKATLADIPSTTDVLLIEPNLDKRTAYYLFLKKQTEFMPCLPLSPDQLMKAAVEYAADHQQKLSIPDARYLIQRVGGDQGRAWSELDKLSLLETATITKEQIDSIVAASPEADAFALIEAMLTGQHEQPIRAQIERLRSQEDPRRFFGLIVSQIYSLAWVWSKRDANEQAIVASTKLHPYVVKKMRSTARTMSLSKLQAITRLLLAVEQQLRSADSPWDSIERAALQVQSMRRT